MRSRLVRLHIENVSPRPKRMRLSTAFGLMFLGFLITMIGLFIWANFFWQMEVDTTVKFVPVTILL